MIVDLLIFVVSLGALLYSSDSLIETASSLAERLKISPMVVGLTLVAVGTSLPEVMASAAAAIEGHPEIAVGNVVGSNICNVALILGLPSIFYPIVCRRRVLMREGMLMLLASSALYALALYSGEVSRTVGIISILLFLGFIFMVLYSSKADESSNENQEESAQSAELESEPLKLTPIILKMLLMLVILIFSSTFLVEATVAIAQALGVSEAIIAISLIALGTSLPELSVSISAARKKQGDILVGNVLGSNISNILLVLGVTSTIKPFSILPVVTTIDLPIMLGLAVAMIGFLYTKGGIGRAKGVVLLTAYVGVILRCIFIGS